MAWDAISLSKLGLRVRELRRGRSMKQEDLAKVLGVSSSQMSHIERGTREPGLSALVKLAEFMDVSLDYLVLGKIPDVIPRGREYLILREDAPDFPLRT